VCTRSFPKEVGFQLKKYQSTVGVHVPTVAHTAGIAGVCPFGCYEFCNEGRPVIFSLILSPLLVMSWDHLAITVCFIFVVDFYERLLEPKFLENAKWVLLRFMALFLSSKRGPRMELMP